MSLTEPRYEEYGRGGDRAGARRTRRAFRFTVLFFVFFAGALWFSEGFLRHELHQSHYLNALTHEPESATVILKQAVREAAETNNPAEVNYLLALAARQDPEEAIESYRVAYERDPATPGLAVRYGVALYDSGRYEEARRMFQEAANQPQRNALPTYLEAAALPRLPGGQDTLDESLALVARTNNSGLEIRFPSPSWFKSLPQEGFWYANLRRNIVQQCSAVLYQYAGFVIASAQGDTPLRQAQYWVPWLEQVQIMGQRLMSSPDRGTIQATMGIQIQLQALRMRQEIKQRVSAEADEAIAARIDSLEPALELLDAFERERDTRIAAHTAMYLRPIQWIYRAAAVLALVYLLTYAAAKKAGAGRTSWTVQHAPLARRVLAAWCVLTFLLLHSATVLQAGAGTEAHSMNSAAAAWWLVVCLTVVSGFAYPALTTPRPGTVLARHGHSNDPAARKDARHEYWETYLSLQRRFFGVALGLFLCSLSTWVVTYRLMTSLYPWQVKLLASGLAGQETLVVEQALALLP